ncbi:alkylhydroperoxidase [Actinoalloteichus sp. AHMU CJ021]|uniref:carboxymuconolactone decarboxylase family protein n=1 Tax=Actinoalloteichus sp. AHMU CJ021 TaxID=2072503 RepID=UPI000CA05BC7|nr:alkylhydroperoxidase [Actinoalloteichus sp. AHMU CJ021]
MTGPLVRAAVRRSLGRTRHVTPVLPSAATGVVAEVYRELERDFGVLAPPIAVLSPAPHLLAASWSLLRETLVVDGAVDRPVKEAVAAAVSASNSCPYCVEVHGSALRGLGSGAAATAIVAGRSGEVGDPRLRAVVEWAGAGGPGAGAPPPPEPFPVGHRAELVGVAVTFQFLNRLVNVFLEESPTPAGVPAGVRGGVRSLLARHLGAAAGRGVGPGASERGGEREEPPPDLGWAAAHPGIGGAAARIARAADRAAGGSGLSERARSRVLDAVAVWEDVGRGPGRDWVEDLCAGLAAPDRAAARLALLTAFRSYQVDDRVVADFRGHHLGDAALVDLVGWSAFTAARRVGRWMAGGG